MVPLRTRKPGMIQRWIALIALALWFASLGAQAQGRLPFSPGPSYRPRLVLPLSGPDASGGKIKNHQGRSLTQGTGQAQVVEGETGENGTCGSDLLPGYAPRVADPGSLGRAGGLAVSGPYFRSDWRAGVNRPRPPPAT